MFVLQLIITSCSLKNKHRNYKDKRCVRIYDTASIYAFIMIKAYIRFSLNSYWFLFSFVTSLNFIFLGMSNALNVELIVPQFLHATSCSVFLFHKCFKFKNSVINSNSWSYVFILLKEFAIFISNHLVMGICA